MCATLYCTVCKMLHLLCFKFTAWLCLRIKPTRKLVSKECHWKSISALFKVSFKCVANFRASLPAWLCLKSESFDILMGLDCNKWLTLYEGNCFIDFIMCKIFINCYRLLFLYNQIMIIQCIQFQYCSVSTELVIKINFSSIISSWRSSYNAICANHWNHWKVHFKPDERI